MAPCGFPKGPFGLARFFCAAGSKMGTGRLVCSGPVRGFLKKRLTASLQAWETTNSLTLGGGALGTGSYDLHGGNLKDAVCTVGWNGTGSFDQSGWAHAITTSLRLGYMNGSAGTYTIRGGLLTAGSSIGVSGDGTGTLDVQGGTVRTPILTVGVANGHGARAGGDGAAALGRDGFGIPRTLEIGRIRARTPSKPTR